MDVSQASDEALANEEERLIHEIADAAVQTQQAYEEAAQFRRIDRVRYIHLFAEYRRLHEHHMHLIAVHTDVLDEQHRRKTV